MMCCLKCQETNDRLTERVKWFEDAGGVAMATRVHSQQSEIDRLSAENAQLRLTELYALESRVEVLKAKLVEAHRILGKCADFNLAQQVVNLEAELAAAREAIAAKDRIIWAARQDYAEALEYMERK